MTAPNNDAQTSCMPDSDFLSTASVYTADTEPADVEMATSMQTEAGLAAQLAPTGTAAKRTKIQLSPGDNPKLFSDMQELKKHYTESISLHRSGNVLAPSTLETMERRVLSKHACIFVCAWTSLNIPVHIYI